MFQPVTRVVVSVSVLLTTLLAVTTPSARAAAAAEDHGLGANYDWQGWPVEPLPSGKPVMVVIHKPSCPACIRLKSWFSASQDILRLSGQFHMVNFVSGTEEAPQLAVDGQYVPRIYFLDREGNVLEHIVNQKGNPEYKYFYFDEASVVESMTAAALEAKAEEEDNDIEVQVQKPVVPEKEL